MEDIENLAMPDEGIRDRISSITVNKKSIKKNSKVEFGEKETVWVKTWGCSHNNSDGEYMAGLLASNGYNVELEDSKKNSCDVWVLNSCTVKGPSEQIFVNEIKKAKSNGIHVVVSGCVPQASPRGNDWDGLSIIGVQQIDRVVEVVEETLKGNTVVLTKDRKAVDSKRKDGGSRLDMPKIRKNPFIEIIPINTAGCLNQCTYCKTKHARGDLGSYDPEEVIARVESVLAEGVVEIWLTSEDLGISSGAYGIDIGVSITDLLWGVVDAIERCDPSGCSMLRVGMTNPPYILKHLTEMAKILSHPRVYAFLHVPVQAASDAVLSDMRRLYTKADFKKVVDTLKENVDDITIATDVICGFPTETAENFEETLELLRFYKFNVLHISQFYPRPGTPAARMPLLLSQEVKRRSREATKIFESYSRNTSSDIGKVIKGVLVTERSNDGKHYVAHDKSYNQVLVPIEDGIMGKKINVKIVGVGKHYIKTVRIDKETISTAAILPTGEKSESKLPKLIRVGRKMVKLANEQNSCDTDDEKFELSMGNHPELFQRRSSIETNDVGKPEINAMQEWLYISIIFGFMSIGVYLLETSTVYSVSLWKDLRVGVKFFIVMTSYILGYEMVILSRKTPSLARLYLVLLSVLLFGLILDLNVLWFQYQTLFGKVVHFVSILVGVATLSIEG
ncbi:hypothetical protein HK099_005658 [Clydaea vesicula]|uniref:Threonylcarbamoyladenosine tRNA methylthiotransferase n=1 Tax=Clydaea vesicula TaxID=447962 RepID=A0AAD5XXG0_9FUNG|nr:hypothetical protein HK099_005658 [Clydaea vesicula]